MTPLARELARLSAREMVAAVGANGAPAIVRRGLALPFFAASRGLGDALALLERELGTLGLPEAAGRALTRFGARVQVSGAIVGEGPRLILANHPGAYDALCLMRAVARRDLTILAADREFLRSLPELAGHLLFVGEEAGARAAALKAALRTLRAGGAILHFPAGKIEPDADFAPPGSLLGAWQPGVSALVRACGRAGGRVFVAGVRGVHSPRAKRLLLTRWAEKRGITTLSPLIQLLVGLKDVHARVRLQPAPESLSYLAAAAQEQELRRTLLSAITAA